MKKIVTKLLITFSLGIGLTGIAAFLFGNLGGKSIDAYAISSSELRAGMIDPVNGKKIKYWVAPMDPTYIRYEPGKSPMGMDLVPKYEEEGEGDSVSTIRVDPVTMQNMGIRQAPVVRKPLTKTIRAYGNVTYDERRLYTINTKFDGWIEKLHINYIGQPVKKGQPLFEIYSPDLVTAQQEFLLALRQYRKVVDGNYTLLQENASRLLEAARTRLRYWDVTDTQIHRLEKEGEARKTITVYAPASGIVLKKNALEGHYVKAGQPQFEIADLSRVWVDVEIYEYELPWIHEKMPAVMDLAYIPGRQFHGRVLFVYPYLSEKTRTARLRLEFDNPGLELKPAMYANVNLNAVQDQESLVIPQEAVVDSGIRKMAFVAKGQGRFEPRPIELGIEVNGGEYQVLSGLAEGEVVVTSAQFLLDSESRLREAVQKMLDVPDTGTQKGLINDPSNGFGNDLEMDHLNMDDMTMS